MQIDDAFLIEMQRRMLRIRRFDEAAIKLVESSELVGPMHTSTNQEAAVVGATMALRDDDSMTGNHRSHGHPIGKGADLDKLMAELLGRREGTCRGKGGSMHLADFSVGSLGESGIVASGVPIAVGAALSAKVRGTDQVGLAFFGDGASNQGNIHESMNLAAVWKLGAIFFCENNGFAISTPVGRSTAVADIASRAVAYDIPGVVVDGQDPLAVLEATSAAVERGRRGEGPTLIEAKTYRTREHAEGIFVEEYRSASEIEEWTARDPIPAFAATLRERGVLDEAGLERLEAEVREEIDAAVEFARAGSIPSAEEAFDDMYANPIGQPIGGIAR